MTMRRKSLIAFVVSLFSCNIGFTHQCQADNVPASHSSIPLRQTGGRPHDSSDDFFYMVCYVGNGTLYLDIEDFSGMIYVELQTLDGRCVHREYYYYTNPYAISTSSLHGDYVIKIKIDDSSYQGYFSI